MDQESLESILSDLPLGAVKYIERVGSTNDEAARWVEQGAPDLALVVAEEQTAGRGRAGRTWYTVPGSALAFSLVLYPALEESHVLPRLTALGALAVTDALQSFYQLKAQIKWPNDVLVERRKVAGILAEAQWMDGKLGALILGIGLNVSPESVNARVLSGSRFVYPAGCLEEFSKDPIDRLGLLRSILERVLYWRDHLDSPEFMKAWEANLALRGEEVIISQEASPGKDDLPGAVKQQPSPVYEGHVVGLAPDGSLRLRTHSGEVVTVQAGELRLRPAVTHWTER